MQNVDYYTVLVLDIHGLDDEDRNRLYDGLKKFGYEKNDIVSTTWTSKYKTYSAIKDELNNLILELFGFSLDSEDKDYTNFILNVLSYNGYEKYDNFSLKL